MTEGPHDKEIAQLFNLSGSIIVRWTSLNWGISMYIDKCKNGTSSHNETYKISDKPTDYRIEHLVSSLKRNGKLFMSESDLKAKLNRMREIRNSIGHWLLAKKDDGSWGFHYAKSNTTVDVASLHTEFVSLYSEINEPLTHIITNP